MLAMCELNAKFVVGYFVRVGVVAYSGQQNLQLLIRCHSTFRVDFTSEGRTFPATRL